MAGDGPGPCRWRVPYEWILGAMFVGTFVIAAWMQSFVVRAAWLGIIAPMAGVALGVRRKPDDPRPRFGPLLPTAALGWLWCVAILLLAGSKSWYWEYRETRRDALEELLEGLIAGWPFAALLGFGAQGLAAVKPGRYRESAVFANASFLLVLAWVLDLSLSSK